uniref:Uncharacterized protein n=1 Tax=viral metagenome TaxID=1070528 RepID=A0A6C0I475_9ZZZZ
MQQEDDLYDEIFQDDQDFLYEDRMDGSYYLGMQFYMTERVILLVNTISPRVYLKYKHEDILGYLRDYSMYPMGEPHVNIIKLHILPDLSYSAINKTYWLRLVQRHWRNSLQKRLQVWKTSAFLRLRELGKTSCNKNNMLRGLMSIYTNPLAKESLLKGSLLKGLC